MDMQHQDSPWSVTKATAADMPALFHFQQQLFADAPQPTTDTVMTFQVTDGPLPEDALLATIENQEAVLVWQHAELVGYVLLDQHSNTRHRHTMLALLQHLVDEEYIDPTWRVAPRFAEGWLPALPVDQRKALQHYALNALLQLTRFRYDAWLYGCRGHADILQQHFDNGWQIIFENGLYYFFIWDLTRLKS